MSKIVTYILGALLAAGIVAAALFYVLTFQPLRTDNIRMQAGMTALDRANAEIKKCRDREARETAWIKPAADAIAVGLSEEIKAGTAEVAATPAGVVVNIAEKILYTPDSVTFAKESPQLRANLAAVLAGKELKDKMIIVGNTTESVPAKGKGRKRTPPKDARALSAERSLALVKFLEQNKVDQGGLVAAAYAEKLPDLGFMFRDHKTVIMIGNQPAPAARPAPPQPAEKMPSAPSGTQAPPKTIPLKQPPAKTN